MDSENNLMNVFEDKSKQIPIRYIKMKNYYKGKIEEYTLVGVLYNRQHTRKDKKSQYIYFPIGSIDYSEKTDSMKLLMDPWLVKSWNFSKRIKEVEGEVNCIFTFANIEQLESHIREYFHEVFEDDCLQLMDIWFMKFVSELYLRFHEKFGRRFKLTSFRLISCSFYMHEKYKVTVKSKFSDNNQKWFFCAKYKDHRIVENSSEKKIDMSEKSDRRKNVKRLLNHVLIKTYTDIDGNCMR